MKKLEQRFSYSAPQGFCAPELFKLHFRMSNGENFIAFEGNKNQMGYYYYTDQEAMQKEIKKFIRRKTIFCKDKEKKQMYFELSNGENICFTYDKVDQYDIKNKLRLYKEMKEHFAKGGHMPYEVRTGVMNEYGTITEKEEEHEAITLTGKFYLK